MAANLSSGGMWNALGSNAGFPDAFRDFSSLSVPSTWRSVLLWCQYVWNHFGAYASAHERLYSYFLTGIDFEDIDDDEQEKWEELTRTRVHPMPALKEMYLNRACYGTAFASLLTPFQRFLTCPQCSSSWRLDVVMSNREFGFTFELPIFRAQCPRCKVGRGYQGKFDVDDRSTAETGDFTVKVWSPHEIEMIHDPWTGKCTYHWRIPEDHKNLIRQGHLLHLENTPTSVLDAVAGTGWYDFEPDQIFAMKELTLAGLHNRGWGLPHIFRNFRQIWYVQVLRRYNEALALDYVIPFRLITPAPRPGAGGGGMAGVGQDMLASMNSGDYLWHLQSMLRRRRWNPTEWHMLPFPVQYQRLGGDAQELAPTELMDQGMEQLLLSIGTPVDFYKGTLQMTTMVPALRLLNAQHMHIPHDGNRFLNWLFRRLAEELTWEKPTVRLKPVTVADDIERTMLAMQLMMSSQISATDGLRALGYDWKTQQRKIIDEQVTSATMQSQLQERMDNLSVAQQIAKGQSQTGPAGVMPQGGGQPPPQGGAGGAGGQPAMMPGPVTQMLQSGTMPQTLDEIEGAADAIAMDLMGRPEPMKDSELRLLRQTSSPLHSEVIKKIEQYRRGTRNTLGNQGLANWQQTGQPPV